MLETLKRDWFANLRGDTLAGLVVALALIPEAIAFSIIAGVDPKVGLYASFSIAVVTAFAGGRPGMISAATGAMALLMVMLVKEHGLQYLLAATVLTGVLQVMAGFLKLGALMRFVSRSVVTGFVNALAILIFLAQLPELTNVTWHVYAMTAAGLGIIYLLPLLTTAVPSPLVCIVVLTGVAMFLGLDIRTVGDMGELPDSLPIFLLPDIPLNLETLKIIFPYALTMAIVGLLESMMTATIVDDLTDTSSDKNRECKGQGVANIAGMCSGYLFFLATRKMPTKRKLVFDYRRHKASVDVKAESVKAEQRNQVWSPKVREAVVRAAGSSVLAAEDEALLAELDAGVDPSITVCAPPEFGFVEDDTCRTCPGFAECGARAIRMATEVEEG